MKKRGTKNKQKNTANQLIDTKLENNSVSLIKFADIMVQYRLDIHIYHKEDKDIPLYWFWEWRSLRLYVPSEWKDVPECVLDEWATIIPEEGHEVLLGGTYYKRMEKFLLPRDQPPECIFGRRRIGRNLTLTEYAH